MLQINVLVLVVLSPNFSLRPYSTTTNDSMVTPVQISWNTARLACHKCPKKKDMPKAVCENEYQPRGDVLKTPDVNLDVIRSNVNMEPN